MENKNKKVGKAMAKKESKRLKELKEMHEISEKKDKENKHRFLTDGFMKVMTSYRKMRDLLYDMDIDIDGDKISLDLSTLQSVPEITKAMEKMHVDMWNSWEFSVMEIAESDTESFYTEFMAPRFDAHEDKE